MLCMCVYTYSLSGRNLLSYLIFESFIYSKKLFTESQICMCTHIIKVRLGFSEASTSSQPSLTNK